VFLEFTCVVLFQGFRAVQFRLLLQFRLAREDTTQWGYSLASYGDGTIQMVLTIMSLGYAFSGQMGRMNGGGVGNVMACTGIVLNHCNAIRDLLEKEQLTVDSKEFALSVGLVVGVRPGGVLGYLGVFLVFWFEHLFPNPHVL